MQFALVFDLVLSIGIALAENSHKSGGPMD